MVATMASIRVCQSRAEILRCRMRISGGRARGIPLVVPRGERVRPATDGLRQAVFSRLGERVVGARFLDLFAGSGAYGLEALSRGASVGCWVEQHAVALDCLRRNLLAVARSAGVETAAYRVWAGDVLRAPWTEEPSPDVVFIDPPYEQIATLAPVVMARVSEVALSTTVVVFEMPGELDLNLPGWRVTKRLGRGARQPTAVFYEREG